MKKKPEKRIPHDQGQRGFRKATDALLHLFVGQVKVILDMAGRIYDAQVKNPGGRVWIPGVGWVKFTRDFSTPGRT